MKYTYKNEHEIERFLYSRFFDTSTSHAISPVAYKAVSILPNKAKTHVDSYQTQAEPPMLGLARPGAKRHATAARAETSVSPSKKRLTMTLEMLKLRTLRTLVLRGVG